MTRPRFGLAMGTYNVHPPSLEFPSKRGGSGTNALTNTLDPSLYPTSPPESKFNSGGLPKIGGSEGGFIGLVVGLAVLFLLCCCAVFYLLHTRPHGGHPGNKNHPRSAADSSSSSAPTGLFASRRKRNAGWVQQRDEFDYDSGEDEDLVGRTWKGKGEGAGAGAAAGYVFAYGDGGSGYVGPGEPIRDDKVRAMASAPPALSRGADADVYTDPFDPERLPESVRRQQAPLPAVAAREEPMEAPQRPTDRSPKESPTTPTFEGGTKFREQF